MFFNNEVAKAKVKVDNSDCKLNIKNIEFRILQKVKIKGDEDKFEHEQEIIDKNDNNKIEAGAKMCERELAIDL